LIKPQDKEVIESIVGSIKQRVFHASRQDGADSAAPPATAAHQLVNAEEEPWRWWSYIKTLLRDTKNAAPPIEYAKFCKYNNSRLCQVWGAQLPTPGRAWRLRGNDLDALRGFSKFAELAVHYPAAVEGGATMGR